MKELDPPSSSLGPLRLTPYETSSWEMEEFSDIGSVSQEHLASVAFPLQEDGDTHNIMEEMEPSSVDPLIDPLGPLFREFHNGLELPQGDLDNLDWFREETQNGVVVLGDNFEWFRDETQNYLDVLREMLHDQHDLAEEEEDRSQEGDNFELLSEETENGVDVFGKMLQDQHDLPLLLEEEEENGNQEAVPWESTMKEQDFSFLERKEDGNYVENQEFPAPPPGSPLFTEAEMAFLDGRAPLGGN